MPYRKPTVSIIVPVYNVQEYIARCLKSLIFQSYSDIEIIVVNDGSTDDSEEIILVFKKLFPNKIIYVRKDNGGPSSARKKGLSVASADWVTFVDSDDWLHPCAIEWMLKKQKEDNSDCVYCTFGFSYMDRRDAIPTGIVSPATKENILKYGNNTFWGKLWNRLFLIENAHFYDIWHEDVAEVGALLSKIDKISYLPEPIYFYYQDNESSITHGREYNERRLELLDAVDLCITNFSNDYSDELKIKLYHMLIRNNNYFELYDKNVAYTKKAFYNYNLSDIEEFIPDNIRDQMHLVLSLPETIIPENIYLNAFNEMEKYGEYVSESFLKIGQMIYLDDETCQDFIDNNYVFLKESERFDELAQYCAIKEIIEKGGIYLSSRFEIINSFDKLKYYPAFFSFESNHSISADLFGGCKGSQLFIFILNQITTDALKIFTVQNIIEQSLIINEGLHLNGTSVTTRNGTHIFSSEWLYAGYAYKMGHVKLRKFNEKSDSFDLFLENKFKKFDDITKEKNQLIKENEMLNNELKHLKNTKSWKITEPLRKGGQTINIIKHIFARRGRATSLE